MHFSNFINCLCKRLRQYIHHEVEQEGMDWGNVLCHNVHRHMFVTWSDLYSKEHGDLVYEFTASMACCSIQFIASVTGEEM